jgi:glycolate oxidase iron-sulfur subunit
VGKYAKPIKGSLPKQFEAMLELLPDNIPASKPLPRIYHSQKETKFRVALLVGCVQHSLAPEINWATLHVLARNGVEIHIPAGQGCCGGLALHTGDIVSARKHAELILNTLDGDFDAIITNAAGCGSSLQDYPLLFKGTKWEQVAQQFTARVVDISVFLVKIGIEIPQALPEPMQIGYHDACHLAHAQGITDEPRKLLNSIPNVTLVPIKEGDLCCGSAGSYNVEQPEIADKLGERKVNHILESGAQIVVTGNIGCIIQLRSHLNAKSVETQRGAQNIPVMHTVEFLDYAYEKN